MLDVESPRVLLVDASQLITEGLRISLNRTQSFRVVGIAHNVADARRCLRDPAEREGASDQCRTGD